MIITMATDRTFLELAGVLIRSICACGDVPEARIVVLGDGLTERDKQKLRDCSDREVEVIDVRPAIRKSLRGLRTTPGWPPVVYTRLLVANLLPSGGRVLYLDCDTIVNTSLRPLFAIDLEGQALAAVGDSGYFNTGVLLVDLDAWRRERVGERTLEYARQHPDQLEFPDQSALNAVLDGQFLRLDERWNVKRKKAGDFRSAWIVHFTGIKPHMAKCSNPAKELFFEHRAQTPWADSPLVGPLEDKVRREWRRLKHLVAGRMRPKSART
jgi:lipopolysaccharide biosynthesis glycosyltransferase